MSSLRFHHVFVMLLLLATLSAFVLPRASGRLQAAVQGIFLPVSAPTRALAQAIRGRETPRDEGASPGQRRAEQDVITENESLRIEVAYLHQQLEDLKKINADREALGDLRALCIPVGVMGADTGRRQSLALRAGSVEGVRQGMAVLYPGGVAGRIERSWVGGSQVRLVSDGESRVAVSFVRFVPDEAGKLEFTPIAFAPQVAHGDGKGGLFIPRLNSREIEQAELREGDWVVLTDTEWPPQVQGYRVGMIRQIATTSDGPLFREIRIEPARKLLALREVMVLVKEGGR